MLSSSRRGILTTIDVVVQPEFFLGTGFVRAATAEGALTAARTGLTRPEASKTISPEAATMPDRRAFCDENDAGGAMRGVRAQRASDGEHISQFAIAHPLHTRSETTVPDRLTRYELELMDVLWDRGAGTVQEVCDALDRDLAYTTVMTTLNLLCRKKKVLERIKQGRAYVYRPTVSREEMSQTVFEDLKPVLFGKAIPSLFLGMLSQEKLEDADIDALRAALDQVDKKRRKRRPGA